MKIVTLTLSPAFDLHCTAENFLPYGESLAKIDARDTGGKGVNISRALVALGVENTALVVLGEENGEEFRRRLAADGVRGEYLTVPGRIRENLTLHTEGKPETRISFAGFRAPDDLLSRVEERIGADSDTALTLTGRLPEGMPMPEVKAFLSRLTARGAKAVIDSRSFSLDDLSEVRPWLIKPNEEEIAAYLGREIRTPREACEAAGELHTRGIANVMITLGKRGAVLANADGTFFCAPPAVTALSTVGAGDSTVAGFLAACTKGKKGADALAFAVAAGTAACLTPGTKPPRAADVADLCSRVTRG